MCRLDTVRFVTDRQTDGQSDDIMMTIDDHNGVAVRSAKNDRTALT